MLVCRKRPDGAPARRETSPPRARADRRFGEGGPVFLPRRKPSALAERLLAGARSRAFESSERRG